MTIHKIQTFQAVSTKTQTLQAVSSNIPNLLEQGKLKVAFCREVASSETKNPNAVAFSSEVATPSITNEA